MSILEAVDGRVSDSGAGARTEHVPPSLLPAVSVKSTCQWEEEKHFGATAKTVSCHASGWNGITLPGVPKLARYTCP